jgi:hypothetical protein
MIDPGVAAVIASIVSLALGLTGILRSVSDSNRAQARERSQRRAEAYVGVLRIVEIRGLAVQDEMYNYTETGSDPYAPSMPRREFSKPARTDRAEARALLAAYGTPETRAAFENWLIHVESWEAKLASWFFENEISGPPDLSSADAEPERTGEVATRAALGDAVSREVKD